MVNPYEVTTGELNASGSLRVRRAIVMGLIGYFGPLFLMLSLCMLNYGWDVMLENARKFGAVHWPIRLTGVLALTPHVLCAGLLAWGSLRVGPSGPPDPRKPDPWKPHPWKLDPWKLGIATLTGYVVLIVVTAFWNPIPWIWPYEQQMLVRLAFMLLFPVCLIAYGFVRNRRTIRPHETDDRS